MFLPLSLYLKTWGRQSSGEAREGQGRAECVACALMHPHLPWPSSFWKPGSRSLLSEVSVYVHVGLLNVADQGRRRLAVWVQQDGHCLLPV